MISNCSSGVYREGRANASNRQKLDEQMIWPTPKNFPPGASVNHICSVYQKKVKSKINKYIVLPSHQTRLFSLNAGGDYCSLAFFQALYLAISSLKL